MIDNFINHYQECMVVLTYSYSPGDGLAFPFSRFRDTLTCSTVFFFFTRMHAMSWNVIFLSGCFRKNMRVHIIITQVGTKMMFHPGEKIINGLQSVPEEIIFTLYFYRRRNVQLLH